MREQNFRELMKVSVIGLVLVSLFFSCGKDNEIPAAPQPVTPIPPVAIQPAKNLLIPFDHSFEEVEMVQRETRPRIRIPSTTHFRVTGTRRREALFDITRIASFEGEKALRLLRGEIQSLIIPTSPRGEKSPLIVESGKRYNFTAFIRFPRQNSNIPNGEVGLRLFDNEEDVGDVFKSFDVRGVQENWYEVRAQFEIPRSVNNAKIVLQVSGSDDLLIDNLQFIEAR